MTTGEDEYISLAEAKRRERVRVAALIEQDRRDVIRENDRKLAELEVREGVFINLDDTVIEPTPEWAAKGDIQSFVPRQHDGTIREIRTVRRVVTPIVMRMFTAGKLTDEQFAACIWYRSTATMAGMEGKAASSQWNATSTIRRGAVDAGFGYVPTSEFIAEARDAYRAAKAALPTFYLTFFEKVVLDDVPIRRAARFAKCRDDKAPRRFREVAQMLVSHLAKVGHSLVPQDEHLDA